MSLAHKHEFVVLDPDNRVVHDPDSRPTRASKRALDMGDHPAIRSGSKDGKKVRPP